jgi:hypothetical protein
MSLPRIPLLYQANTRVRFRGLNLEMPSWCCHIFKMLPARGEYGGEFWINFG